MLTRPSIKLFYIGDRDNNPVGGGSGKRRGEAPAADRGADTRVQGLGIFLSGLGGHQVSWSHWLVLGEILVDKLPQWVWDRNRQKDFHKCLVFFNLKAFRKISFSGFDNVKSSFSIIPKYFIMFIVGHIMFLFRHN